MTAAQAIARSVSHTEVVTIDYDLSLELELAAACDDHVETETVVEFWGTTEGGDEWRVHLRGDQYDRLASARRLLREDA